MVDESKNRMNLVAIKKVDPYAKDIVDTSSHVAFYTFNSDLNEWEKTDVEGAFFIYSRNAQPFNSIFINNRLNTTSFVEPITSHLELQLQPPFLLYRNERSRIRGFWFYNSDECDRVGNLVSKLVQQSGTQPNVELQSCANTTLQNKHENVNLFKMLSDAQQQYNNTQNVNQSQVSVCETTNSNVMEFFAAAKPKTADVPFFKRLLPNTLSVEQLEKQQRVQTPLEETQKQVLVGGLNMAQSVLRNTQNLNKSEITSEFTKFLSSVDIKGNKVALSVSVPISNSLPNENETCLRKLLVADSALSAGVQKINIHQDMAKPALIPPTMFDKPLTGNHHANNSFSTGGRQEPLNSSQFVQALNYLLQNDQEFVQKLHDAYLKTFTKTFLGSTYQ